MRLGWPAAALLLTTLPALSLATHADTVARRIVELELSTGQRQIVTLYEWLGSLYLRQDDLPMRDLEPQAVAALTVTTLPEAGACYRLDDLGRYDENRTRAQATLQLPVSLLRKRRLSARAEPATPVPLQAGPALSLSYVARGLVQDDAGAGRSVRYGIEPLLNIGFGRFGTLGSSGFIGNAFSRRGDTTYRYYDAPGARRFAAGDIAALAGTIGSSPRLAGIQIARDFSLNDNFLDRPAYALDGQTALPATLDVFVDGQKRLSEQLSGGQYEVRDLDVSTSGSDVELVLTNALGEREVIRTRLFGNNFRLAQGASDFSFEAGAARTDENRYDGHFVAGTYRYGLLPWLAAEVHAEEGDGDFGLGSAAVSVNHALGRFLLGGGMATQTVNGLRETGAQGRASWSLSGRVGDHVNLGISADASLSDQFRRYRATTTAPDVTRFSAFASVHGAALRGSYTDAGGIRSAQSELLLARGSLSLVAGTQYFFTTRDWLGTLTLGWQPTRPAGLPNLAYRHSVLRDGSVDSLQANDFLPSTRTSYSVSAARQADDQGNHSDQGSLNLSQSLDDLQASYALQQNRDSRSQSLTLVSAIAWHDWQPYATSYIGERQGYASVDANLPDLRLTQGISDEYTDARGIAVFTIPAFSRSDIRADLDSLPRGYRLDGATRSVSVSAGAQADVRYRVDTPGFFLRIPGFTGSQITFNQRVFNYGPRGAYVVSGQVGDNELSWGHEQRTIRLRELRTDAPTYLLDAAGRSLQRLIEDTGS